MKYIPLLLLALFLASCSSKPIITLDMQNYTRADWILVSVRDSSIVVLPPYEAIGKGIAFTHAVVIPTRAISRIILHPKSVSFFSRLMPALFGAGAGFALKACNCDDRVYHMAIGLGAGWTFGGFLLLFESLLNGEDAYFLWLESDRVRLRKSAVFPVEPEIMKYVR